MSLLRIAGLPDDPLAAAATFHGQWLPQVIAHLGRERGPVTLVFAPADHTHRAWRLAAVQSLARKLAPRRINAVASDDQPAIDAAAAYLDGADGVTGQLLLLDSLGAGDVVRLA